MIRQKSYNLNSFYTLIIAIDTLKCIVFSACEN